MFKDFLVGAAILAGGIIVVGGSSFFMYAVTKPASIAVDNRAFHAGQPYIDGMARDLGNFQISYMNSNSEQRSALRAVILDRYAGFDENLLPPNLRAFLDRLKNGE
jgi:hypothetical protein